jgi:hypothetical protein
MKRYINYFLLTLMLMTTVISGCKKALEEDPKTFISPENFFKNPDSYELAVVGIYAGLPLYSGNSAMMLEMCTDIYGAPASAFEQALPMYQNAPAAFYYNTREAWGGAYSIIKNANFILDELCTCFLTVSSEIPNRSAISLYERFSFLLSSNTCFIRGGRL